MWIRRDEGGMKQDIEFCAYMLIYHGPFISCLAPGAGWVLCGGWEARSFEGARAKGRHFEQLLQPVILNFEIRKSCRNLVLARLSGLVTLVGRKINAGKRSPKVVFKLWDKTRGRQWCVCSEAQHAIVKSDKTCRTVDSLLAEQVGIHLDPSGKLLYGMITAKFPISKSQ